MVTVAGTVAIGVPPTRLITRSLVTGRINEDDGSDHSRIPLVINGFVELDEVA